MQRGKKNMKLFYIIVALLFAAATEFALKPSVNAQTESESYAESAIKDAEKARKDAKKAIIDAEKAIAVAEKAILEADKAQSTTKKDKANALEQMVLDGHNPKDFFMTVQDSPVTAVFSHKKHTEREKLKCVECHPKVFIMKVGSDVVKKGHLTMEEMKKGKYCANCHNGEKAFSVASIKNCKRCHPKQ